MNLSATSNWKGFFSPGSGSWVVTNNDPVATLLLAGEFTGQRPIGSVGPGQTLTVLIADELYYSCTPTPGPISITIFPKASTTYAQPLAERLKGAASSRKSDVYQNGIPITTPPAWVLSTVYFVGQVVVNGGNMYQCIIAGTSAGSGGPTGTSMTTVVVDNTASWFYLGPPNPASSTVDAPTQTRWNGSSPTGITNPVEYKISNGGFTPSRIAVRNSGLNILDKFQAVYGVCSTYLTGTTTGNINGAVPGFSQSNARYEFMTDALAVAPVITDQAPCKIYIDDVPLDVGATMVGATSSSTNGTTFTFPSKKLRKIAIEIPQGISFVGVWVGQSDSLYAPNEPYQVRALFLMDSYAIGGNGFPLVAGKFCANQAGQALGWSDIVSSGVSGTGIFYAGANGQGNFASRIPTDVAGGYPVVPTSVNNVTTSVAQAGNLITVANTALSSTPFVGQSITLSGLTPSSLNGTYTVQLGSSPTSTACVLVSTISQAVTATVQGTITLNFTPYHQYQGIPWKPYDVIVTHISVNDPTTGTNAQIAAAAVSLYQGLRMANPTSVICMVGCVDNSHIDTTIGIGTPVAGSFLGAATTTLGYLEAFVFQQVQAAISAAGDTKAFLMPVTAITDNAQLNSIQSIFQGSGYTGLGSPAGSASNIVGNNSNLMAFGSPTSGVHVTDQGARLWGISFANWFKNTVLPALA